RERRQDILPLARVLLKAAAERAGTQVTGLAPDAADRLLRHDWPGNVRELENALESAAVLATGTRIRAHDLPEHVRQALPSVQPGKRARTLADVEREYVLAVLEKHRGHRAKTAAELGIGSATLFRK